MHTALTTAPEPAATPVIDEQKLYELLGRAIIDFGGATSLAARADRRSPGPVSARWPPVAPLTSADSPRRPAPPSATSASG